MRIRRCKPVGLPNNSGPWRQHEKGSEIAVVTVQPSDSPAVRYKGRIWIRVGPRRAVASSQEERILNEKRRYKDIPFDVQPLPSCVLSALSRVLFEQECLLNAVAPDILAANERSYEEKLATCRMIASVAQGLYLVPGDVALAAFEDTLSAAWPVSMGDTNLYRHFRILSAFWQIVQMAAKQVSADIILILNFPGRDAPSWVHRSIA